MRITIESAGFTDAADACRAANQIAAMVTETLAGKLGGFGGMAGNDSTSVTFAGSYDDAARQALDTLTELTHAFIGLGRIIEATGATHRRAEIAAVCGSGGAGLPCDPVPEVDSYDHVSPADPPTCLGGQEPSFGTVDRWILDHVEGFVWPGADVALLREAAATWRSAALSIDHLDHHVDDVAQLLSRQRSPEIPLALDVLADVRSLVGDAALCLSDLGQACEDYASAVEETHDRTRALLAEIGQMIVEGAVLSVLVAGFTGGLGGGAAAGAVIARITSHAPRFRALQSSLQLAAATSATKARAARDGLRVVRERAEKLARVGARDERGSMKSPLGWGGASRVPGRPKPEVQDVRLKNYVNNLFKGTHNQSRVGDGTTMDAIRRELATGDPTHGRMHIIKGRETLRGLEKWLTHRSDASPADRQVAQSLINELKDVLGS
ncbi:hypothetical protein EXE58_11865 [Nocardioides seonyuensis]|uniref:Uncharacterized protein n=1 Tax=Nocardioides seonyuensis TaxID=2518371 RepID=A0A4V1BME5_9ACTN|nr:hypothetical protein [Nocardioides seonyuensis]QBX56092.1 hypothetical protein EXE58_11865 [Nocardioides seonyuensis]